MMINDDKTHLCDLPGLVVASQQSHSVRPASFEDHQPGESLQAVVTPVHKVSHEDVVGVWRRSPLPEQLLQVVELSVDISAYLTPHRVECFGGSLYTNRDRRADWLNVGLLQQEITDQVAQLLQLVLGQIFAILQFKMRK